MGTKITSPRQKKAIDLVVESGGLKAVSVAMVEAGFSPATAKNPSKLTKSKAWIEIMEKHFSDTDLAKAHKELMHSTRIDHMVFPLGPSEEEDEGTDDESVLARALAPETTSLTDEEIKEMLAEVNCKVRRIVHGQTARHVYFWAVDNKARKDALDMAYKLKAKYAPERTEHLYGFMIAPEDRERIDAILQDNE